MSSRATTSSTRPSRSPAESSSELPASAERWITSLAISSYRGQRSRSRTRSMGRRRKRAILAAGWALESTSSARAGAVRCPPARTRARRAAAHAAICCGSPSRWTARVCERRGLRRRRLRPGARRGERGRRARERPPAARGGPRGAGCDRRRAGGLAPSRQHAADSPPMRCTVRWRRGARRRQARRDARKTARGDERRRRQCRRRCCSPDRAPSPSARALGGSRERRATQLLLLGGRARRRCSAWPRAAAPVGRPAESFRRGVVDRGSPRPPRI